MSYKILNTRFAGKTVAISEEIVEFDNDGIGELESENIYLNALNIPHFFAVEDKVPFGPKPDGEVTPPVTQEDEDLEKAEALLKALKEVEDAKKDATPALVTDNMSHKELDAKALELEIEVSGEKKDKVNTINQHIVDNF